MPTSWIAALGGVLVLAAAGVVAARLRRGNRSEARAGAAPASGSGPVDVAAAGAAVQDEDQALHATPPMLEPETAILAQLCARACAVVPAVPAPADAARAAVDAAVEVLEGIRAHPRYTPRRPQLLPQLTRAINDPAASAQSIAAILAQDPALAGNLLRIANSALYRRRGTPIEQLERAVTVLGTEGLRQTVMAALLQPVIADDGSVFARCAAVLWEHTLLSANFAIRPGADAGRDDLHAAQLLALLHGLGEVMVVQVLRDTWSRHGQGDPEPSLLASLLAAWSLRCARVVSAEWGLSDRMQQALDNLAADPRDGAPGNLELAVRASRSAALRAMPAMD